MILEHYKDEVIDKIYNSNINLKNIEIEYKINDGMIHNIRGMMKILKVYSLY